MLALWSKRWPRCIPSHSPPFPYGQASQLPFFCSKPLPLFGDETLGKEYAHIICNLFRMTGLFPPEPIKLLHKIHDLDIILKQLRETGLSLSCQGKARPLKAWPRGHLLFYLYCRPNLQSIVSNQPNGRPFALKQRALLGQPLSYQLPHIRVPRSTAIALHEDKVAGRVPLLSLPGRLFPSNSPFLLSLFREDIVCRESGISSYSSRYPPFGGAFRTSDTLTYLIKQDRESHHLRAITSLCQQGKDPRSHTRTAVSSIGRQGGIYSYYIHRRSEY